MPLFMPAYPVKETGVLELVGADERVDQNELGAEVSFTLPGVQPASGILLAFTFFGTETGTGAIPHPAGQLLIFDADPGLTAGDDGSGVSAAELKTLIAVLDVADGDWTAEDNGAFAHKSNFEPIPFHAVQTLYFVWRHTDATNLNDAAADDEVLEVNVWYQRYS